METWAGTFLFLLWWLLHVCRNLRKTLHCITEKVQIRKTFEKVLSIVLEDGKDFLIPITVREESDDETCCGDLPSAKKPHGYIPLKGKTITGLGNLMKCKRYYVLELQLHLRLPSHSKVK